MAPVTLIDDATNMPGARANGSAGAAQSRTARKPKGTGGAGQDIASLTGIRAIAVMIVFTGHSGISFSPSPLAVTVFFFLSGYLITTLLRREFTRTGSISLRAFYLRRACRILPPLYIVLLLANLVTLAGWSTYGGLRPGAVLSQFFFFNNYHILATGWTGPSTGTPPGTGALWSLAVEEHFYLLFPIFYLLLCRYLPSPRKQVAVLAALCGLILTWRLVLILGMHASFDRTYVGSDTRMDSLLFGCMLAILGNPVIDQPGTSRVSRLWAPVLAPVALIVMLLVYPWPHDPGLLRHTAFSGTFQYTIQGLALIPIFVVAIRYANWGVLRTLNHPWVVFIGVLSYSIYISEEVINELIHKNFAAGRLVHGPMYAVFTLAFVWLMYRLVEKPFARIRKRLSRGQPSEGRPAENQPAESQPTCSAPSIVREEPAIAAQ